MADTLVSSSPTDGKSETKVRRKIDFSRSITDFRRRARKARSIRSTVAVFMVIVAMVGIVGVFYEYTSSDRFEGFRNLEHKMELSTDYSPDQVFLRHADEILSNLYPSPLGGIAYKMDTGVDAPTIKLSAEDRTNQMKEVNDLVGLYERAAKAQATEKQQPKSDGFTSVISAVAFSAGAVVVSILLIQICVTFIRYYAQLAELYDAQAGALEASDGDANLAIKFAEHFSPNSVTFGKLPTTLYEKSLDAITELARSRLKS